MSCINYFGGKERKKPRESSFPVAFQWKPVCFAVESIVLRLFKTVAELEFLIRFDAFVSWIQRFPQKTRAP